MSNESGINAKELAGQLGELGIANKSDIDLAIKNGMKQVADKMSAKHPESDNDILYHMRGGCKNPECEIAKEAQEIYRDGFTKGAAKGAKLGYMAARKGVNLTGF